MRVNRRAGAESSSLGVVLVLGSVAGFLEACATARARPNKEEHDGVLESRDASRLVPTFGAGLDVAKPKARYKEFIYGWRMYGFLQIATVGNKNQKPKSGSRLNTSAILSAQKKNFRHTFSL